MQLKLRGGRSIMLEASHRLLVITQVCESRAYQQFDSCRATFQLGWVCVSPYKNSIK